VWVFVNSAAPRPAIVLQNRLAKKDVVSKAPESKFVHAQGLNHGIPARTMAFLPAPWYSRIRFT
jgi:hypothetical protein